MSGRSATGDADHPTAHDEAGAPPTPTAPGLLIRPLDDEDRSWIEAILVERWLGTTIVSRGTARDASRLPGLAAVLDGEPAGAVTWVDANGERELVTLDAIAPRLGVGRALVAAAVESRPSPTHRLWLVTTNDNVDALIFFQRLGFHLAAVHAGAVDVARRLKPAIPEVAANGVPIRDEIELEMRFESPAL